MPKQCPDCERIYPDFVDFCVADAMRLCAYVAVESDAQPAPAGERDEPTSPTLDDDGPRARLFPMIEGELGSFGVEFCPDVVLGRFEPGGGEVDVDLGSVPEAECISPQHARLTREDGGWFVEDLGSDNGVFINDGPRLEVRTALGDGDKLALGTACFVFEVVDDGAGGAAERDMDTEDDGGLAEAEPAEASSQAVSIASD